MLERETGRELDRFESPAPEEIGPLAQWVDGSRLILAPPSQGALY